METSSPTANLTIGTIRLAHASDVIRQISLSRDEISVKGKWHRVPILNYNGKRIFAKGRCLRIARLADEDWLETELEYPEQCATILKNQGRGGLGADIFTFTQKLPATTPKWNCHTEWDSVAAVRTTSFAEWWQNLPRQSRQNVRRAQKCGIEVSVRALDDQLLRGIMGVNNDSPIRQGTVYTHYGKTFEEVKKDHSAFLDRSDFICAYLGDELVGFIWVVYRGQIASILQILTKASLQDRRPANALIAKAVEVCHAKGLLYLTFGMFNYGNKRLTSLREFKERNGFSEILVPRYYIALTRWGRLCMRVRLHRGLLGILPHGAIMAALRFRTLWVNFAA